MIHRGRLNTLKDVKPTVLGSVTSCNYSQYHRIITRDINSCNSILIQSPLTTIVNKNRNWLSFKISIEETSHKVFVDELTLFSNKLHLLTQKRYNKQIQFDTPLIVGNTATFYASIVDGCKIYDTIGNLSKHSPMKASPAEFIFCISQVQVSSTIDSPDELYGRILIEIVQIRLHDINAKPLEDFGFEGKVFVERQKKSVTNETVDVKEEQIIVEGYEKYFKMLKMGIPKPAVRQRMNAEGVDPDVLDGKKPLKPRDVVTIDAFSADKLKTQALKKTVIIKKKQPRGGIGIGISLDTIQSALSGLRKTKFLPFGS